MRSRPKFEEEYQYIKQRLTTEFGETHPIHRFPIIVVHELDVKKRGRGQHRQPHETYVMISFDDFINMIEPTEQNSSKDPHGPIHDVLDIM